MKVKLKQPRFRAKAVINGFATALLPSIEGLRKLTIEQLDSVLSAVDKMNNCNCWWVEFYLRELIKECVNDAKRDATPEPMFEPPVHAPEPVGRAGL